MAHFLKIGKYSYLVSWLVGWLCFTPNRQRGHLETARPFTVPCKGREARSLHSFHRNRTPDGRVASHNRCATPASLP